MEHSAFFADNQHEVSMLESGHRAALVYTLVYKPTACIATRSIFQPVDVKVVKEIDTTMRRFAEETDEDYVDLHGMNPGNSLHLIEGKIVCCAPVPTKFHIKCMVLIFSLFVRIWLLCFMYYVIVPRDHSIPT